MADIEGDNDDNTLNGTSNADNIKGKGGNDNINGGSGNDTISGGSGNDTIDGGGGDDVIYGGAGDDVITGGAGDDLIIGGRGDDTLSAGSGSPTDTFLIRDGDGNDTVTDFDPPEPDIIKFDMVEMNSYQDVLDRISTSGPDTIITYDNGSTLRLLNVDPADLSSTNFQFGPGPACLHAGTFVATADGNRAIETLLPGDMVLTADHGLRKILDIVSETVVFTDLNDRRKPIFFPSDTLDQTVPHGDIIASPQHRFLVRNETTNECVLVPAIKLMNRKGVRRMRGRKSAHYFNLVLDNHEIIFANGCAVETMLITSNNVHKISLDQALQNPNIISMKWARRIVDNDPIAAVA